MPAGKYATSGKFAGCGGASGLGPRTASQSMTAGWGPGGTGSHRSGEGDLETGAGGGGGRGTGVTAPTGRPGRVSEDDGRMIRQRNRVALSVEIWISGGDPGFRFDTGSPSPWFHS